MKTSILVTLLAGLAQARPQRTAIPSLQGPSSPDVGAGRNNRPQRFGLQALPPSPPDVRPGDFDRAFSPRLDPPNLFGSTNEQGGTEEGCVNIRKHRSPEIIAEFGC
ncbi:hypothetical protein G6O67_005597 [Ophiocordyceps sinensis]|uniref:Uncharacterized protein n=2 Tax=Ophiocordyceps sinensis TaxID=72228 RepID=A0A8H4PRZ5_9HYPO|nr:hypothetical protein OCS_04376 [Ophiocordyceps sinensis CO18]KAF4509333.1 hypothetical protein G6O67_005597 [Ophiocordyceps sinensis]